MKVLVGGMLLFCFAIGLQLIIWKIHLPRRQTKTLLRIFFSVLIFGFVVFLCLPYFYPGFIKFCPSEISEYVHISFFFISLTLAYIITYSAIEVDSPSLLMINEIASAGLKGLDKTAFMRSMSDEILVKPRLKDLINDNMAYLDGDKYKLTLKGTVLAGVIILYRRILGLPKGG